MNLRERIQRIIERRPDAEIAAKDICWMLDDHLSLYGNGWFDGDPVMTAMFEGE